MLAGIPINSPVMLNTIRVHVISTILGKGSQGLGKMCTGQIVKALNLSEAILRIDQDRDDQILLTHTLEEEFKPLLPKLKGVILEEYSTIPHDEILLSNPNIVLISKVHDALATFENDLIVSMDGEEKLIYEGVVEEKTPPVSSDEVSPEKLLKG
jgi:pyruvate kinase